MLAFTPNPFRLGVLDVFATYQTPQKPKDFEFFPFFSKITPSASLG
jgi:hypothetical protein